MAKTAISRRIGDAISAMRKGDFENAALNYFAALDKTAKDNYPNEKKVGKRIRKFIDEHEGLITFIATENVFIDCTLGGNKFSDVIYTFGRCSIMHEGELDPRLTFDSNGCITMGASGWKLTPDFLIALIIAVILAPTNHDESLPNDLGVVLLGKQHQANNLWGQREKFLKTPPYSEFNDLYRKL
ncbi:hypothetical protein [Pseudomonas sp. Marseille-QA0332]